MTGESPETSIRAAAAAIRRHRLATSAWGQRPDSERGNVIAAAQALHILHRAGVPLGDEDVTRTLRHLSVAGIAHASPIAAGGRGQFTRYVSFSLEGLLTYSEARGDATIGAAINRHVAWLLERQTPGGWAEEPSKEPSAFATARVLRALRRSGAPTGALKDGAKALLELRHDHGYWTIDHGSIGPSAGLTAIAMEALAGLTSTIDERLARSGDWLASSQRAWLRGVETEELPGTTWHHPAYALVPPALARLGRLDGAAAERAADFLSELWHPGLQGWRHPGDANPTTRGTWAAVLCWEGLHAGLLAQVSVGDGLRALGERVGTWTIALDARPTITVSAEDGYAHTLPLRPRLWDLLDAIRQAVGTGAAAAIDRADLAAHMGYVGSSSLSKEMTRLRESLAAETGGRVREVVTPAGRGRWRLVDSMRLTAGETTP